MTTQPVLIGGQWTASDAGGSFRAINPLTREELPDEYPVSSWEEIESAITAARATTREMRGWSGSRFADFLDDFAARIEARTDDLVKMAHAETGLPASPRLQDVELPRTINQLRQAATAARDGSWATPIIDTNSGIRSMFGPLGPVAVFGPNNFPFAFNSIAGGDFAAAIAAGNPVIAKGHSSHPGTTRLFAECAHEASAHCEMPAGFVQLIYRTSHEDGARLVGHPAMGGCGYTGSRQAGLVLKEAADRAGKPIYLELSSINPVVLLPGALQERRTELVQEFTGSCLMGTGQFCTNPGLVVLLAGEESESFIAETVASFNAAPVGTMLSQGVEQSFLKGVEELQAAGAQLLTGGESGGGNGFSARNTLLRAPADRFLAAPEQLQAEAFGNGSLFIVAETSDELVEVLEHLEGNLTGSIYSCRNGSDDALYDRVAPVIREKVGRLLNDKMPTGVAVSAAMNHGGPFPATGHPGFTAVGMPTAIHRFAMLQSFDAVRPQRLPEALRDENPSKQLWRCIDGEWTVGDVS